MNVIGMITSPHRDGNTAQLVREALKAAADEGAQTGELFLPDYNIAYCKGCFSCMAKGKCPIPDDFEQVKGKLLAADGLIIGSPCYGLDPNAIYKTFYDRIGMFSVYTSSMGGKYIAGISAGSAFGAGKVAKKLTRLGDGFFKKPYITGILGVTTGWKSVGEHPEALHKAYALGSKLARAIGRKKRYPFQGLMPRLIKGLFLNWVFIRNILTNKDGRMKGVYDNLISRGLFKG